MPTTNFVLQALTAPNVGWHWLEPKKIGQSGQKSLVRNPLRPRWRSNNVLDGLKYALSGCLTF
jgi:hypothetical protein